MAETPLPEINEHDYPPATTPIARSGAPQEDEISLLDLLIVIAERKRERRVERAAESRVDRTGAASDDEQRAMGRTSFLMQELRGERTPSEALPKEVQRSKICWLGAAEQYSRMPLHLGRGV